jgi:hypothetical protein
MKNDWKINFANNFRVFSTKFWVVINNLSKCLLVLAIISFCFVYIFKNINEPIALTILEYIKVLVWPFTILFLVFVFKSNIASFIDRMTEWDSPFIGKGKAQAVNEAFQQENTARLNMLVTNTDDKDFKALIDVKENELSELKKNNSQLIDLLTRSQVELDFERIFNSIFASQIDLLLKISNFPSVELAYVMDHFSKAQQAGHFVLKNWELSSYLRFLLENNLIEIIVDQHNISITQKGRAFLFYLSKMNYKKYGF